MSLDLYIGNKNYSSWSLRPWLLLKHLNIPFTEHMVSVTGGDYNPKLLSISKNAKVPCLYVDGFQIWESIAIAEYLAEQHPQLWPADAKARARARSISAEMHSGFGNLRKAMPFNLKFKFKGKQADEATQRDIDRIIEIWTEARTQFATSNGPYLFGDLTVADGMYAPIVCRFETYNVPLPPVAAEYRDAMLAHPAMKEWYEAGLKETEAHAHTDALEKEYGGMR